MASRGARAAWTGRRSGGTDRDAHFSYLNDYAQEHLAAGCPVISADTKKKELATRLIPGSSLEVDHRDPWRQLSPLVMGPQSTDGRNQLGRPREAITCLVRRVLRSFDE